MQPLGQMMSTDSRAASSSASWYVCGSWSSTAKTGVGAGMGLAAALSCELLDDDSPLGSEAAAVGSGVSGRSLADGPSFGSEAEELGSELCSVVLADDAGASSSELSDDQIWETRIPMAKAAAKATTESRTRPDLSFIALLPAHFPNQRKGAAKLLPMPVKPMESRFPNHANQDTTRVSGGSVWQS